MNTKTRDQPKKKKPNSKKTMNPKMQNQLIQKPNLKSYVATTILLTSETKLDQPIPDPFLLTLSQNIFTLPTFVFKNSKLTLDFTLPATQ